MIEGRDDGAAGGRIRYGMVGGGQGAFIGAVHRLAARMDDQFELVAGALASDPERARASGAELGLDPERVYVDWAEMARAEAERPDGIEAVAIVTPNDLHFPVARAFLEAGIHVICDKPLVTTSTDAEALAKIARTTGRVFVLTHNYSGYPMIRHARELVRSGALGELRVVQAEYAQDWLVEPLEQTGHKQAGWRTDPARTGAGGAVGDIGTHAFQLLSYVTGLEVEALSAQLTSFVPGRRVDDDVQVLLRFRGGARGMLWASQVATGNENGLRLRVYGTRAGIEWEQEQPNHLWLTPLGEPRQRITRGGPTSGAAAARVTRVPAGHPEGYLEGFATIYAEAARAIRAARGGEPVPADVETPGIADGVAGVAFIEACIASSRADARWTPLG